MKITKAQLKKIILQELTSAQAGKEAEIASVATSTAARKKGALERISDAEKEFTSLEKGVVDQMEAYFSNLAAVPGVDLNQHRAYLQRVLKQIEKMVAKQLRDIAPETQATDNTDQEAQDV